MVKRLSFTICLLLGLIMHSAMQANADAGSQVDVELVMAVDVSGSMSPTELRIQRRGYAEALRSDEVWDAISSGLIGSVAVIYVEWARSDLRNVIVPWTKISNREEAFAVADQLLTADYQNMRRTSITGAINRGLNELKSNDYQGLRQVIDISGDGPNNEGGRVTLARDEAVAQGVVINGLPIVVTGELSGRFGFNGDLAEYYRQCVIGGPGAFVIPVTNWEGFGEAVRRKLVLELAGMPLPDMPAQTTNIAFLDPKPYDCMIGEKLRRMWEDP